MYKLLIVDDEEYITNALYYFFLEQEELQLETSRAYSAGEALALFQKERFDIVLSDICMPGMDGIAMMKHIKAHWPACRIIFFTGHRDFDYTYEALQYPGVFYILKAEGYDRIRETVVKALEDIARQYSRQVLCAPWNEGKQSILDAFQADYLLRLLTGEGSIPAYPKDSGDYCPEKKSLLLLGRALKGKMTPELLTYAQRALELELGERKISWLVTALDKGIAWAFQAENLQEGESWITQSVEKLLEYIGLNFGIPMVFMLGIPPREQGDLRKCYGLLCKRGADIGGEEAVLLRLNTEDYEEPDHAVEQVIMYLKENYSRDISLGTVAEHMYFNASYLSWLFKKHTGQNFQKYLNDLRLTAACRLLQESNQKIAQIAQQVGFGSSKYFISVFKKTKGLTPQEWRNR